MLDGMKIEVVGKIVYTVHLSEEDVEKVREWIQEKKMNNSLPFGDMEQNICSAVFDLHEKGEIHLYTDGKCTETGFSTEEVHWADHEKRDPEEILGESKCHEEEYG